MPSEKLTLIKILNKIISHTSQSPFRENLRDPNFFELTCKGFAFILILQLISFSLMGQQTNATNKTEKRINHTDSNGLKQGLWIYYINKFEVTDSYAGHYTDGKKIGSWFYHNYNGFLIRSEEYSRADDTLFVRNYDSKQRLESEGKAVVSSEMDTIYFEEPETGELRINISKSEDFIECGLWKSFWSNGNLMSTGYFANGQKVGIWKYYNSKGKLLLERSQNFGRIPCFSTKKD